MTLEEAIKYCEEIAERDKRLAELCKKYSRLEDGWEAEAEKYFQIADWLKELKAYKEKSCVAVLDKIRAEIEQLPTNTRINWDGCCPDPDYPEIEFVDVSKKALLGIIDKYRIDKEE